jgi:hypothetical protein
VLSASRIEREQQQYTDAQIDNLRRDMVGIERGSPEREGLRPNLPPERQFRHGHWSTEKSIDKLGGQIEEMLERLAERMQKTD